MKPRNAAIEQLVQDCADGKLPFSGPNSLCEKVATMGYKTTSLYELTELLDHAALIIRDPVNVGTRTYPPDMSKTPFRQIADELAERSVREFSASVRNAVFSLEDWERLRTVISWRIANALYQIAFPNEPKDEPHA